MENKKSFSKNRIKNYLASDGTVRELDIYPEFEQNPREEQEGQGSQEEEGC